MKKIVVIGGNQGGLAMAMKLGSLGHEVALFEKLKREDVAFDWHDFINPTIFKRLNLPLINKENFEEKKNWIFVSPGEKAKIPVGAGNCVRDICIMRRPLNDYLFSLAEKCAQLNYSCEVESLIIKDGGVCGVRVGGEEIYADLTVDCSGVYSPFRKSLPAEFKIQAQPHENEVLVSYRGFYERKSDVPEAEIINKLYFQHNNEKGLSWFAAGDEPNNVDVLISRIGKLDESTVQSALEKLKADNPALGDRLLRCGITTAIPLRYPISRMVANGYVLSGNSAFMTIPLMGSGIACSLLCAQILSEVLSKDESCELGNLWKYQVSFYEESGAKNTGIDVLKRWMISIDSKDLDFFFESGILNREMLAAGGGGNKPKITPKLALNILLKGARHPALLAKLFADLTKMKKATAVAQSIPQDFDEKAVCTWQKKLDGIFSSYPVII
jgi:flavin-dependent dehydrogenase